MRDLGLRFMALAPRIIPDTVAGNSSKGQNPKPFFRGVYFSKIRLTGSEASPKSRNGISCPDR